MPAENEPDPLTDSPLCTGDPLAKALSVLEPMPTALNRDQLMFAAGAAGRDRDVTFWKRVVYGQATAACLFVGVGIALFGFQDGNTRGGGGNTPVANRDETPAVKPPMTKQTLPEVTPPTPTPSATDDSADAARLAKYLRLRADVLSIGINALPNPHAPSSNVDVGKLEDSLQLPRGTFATHGATKKPAKPNVED